MNSLGTVIAGRELKNAASIFNQCPIHINPTPMFGPFLMICCIGIDFIACIPFNFLASI
jgi:hypothetical protein